jgi:Flp pilus assembly pilin Flp
VRLREAHGQTIVEYLGVLVGVVALASVLSMTGVAGDVTGAFKRVVCDVVGSDCGATEAKAQPQAAVGDGPDQGPPIGTGQEIVVLPFPGSVSVTCTVGPRDEGAPGAGRTCKGSDKSGPKVEPSKSTTIERTQTKLNAKGCPQQTLSVATTLRIDESLGIPGGKLKAFTAGQSKYSVTTDAGRADRIAKGQDTLPNPLDPSSLGVGDSIQMSKEFYAGLGLEANYHALQAELGYDSGKRVSSGVTRLSDRFVRVYVGDEEFVREALALGVGKGGAKLSASYTRELSDGKLRAIDIDIASPDGWKAYQDFLAGGRLPADGAAGTTNPTTTDTHKYSNSAKVEAKLGEWKLGGMLQDAEANVAVTHNPDGGADESIALRYRDVGLEVTDHRDANGNKTRDRTYALNLEGVDPEVYANFQKLNFRDPAPPKDGNVRMEFTPSDLMGIRRQALETVAAQMENEFGVHPRPSADEVADILAKNDGRIVYGPHDTEFSPHPPVVGMLANMRTPDEMMAALFRLANGDPDGLLTGPLTDFILAVNDANGDIHQRSPRNRLPGTLVEPSCG